MLQTEKAEEWLKMTGALETLRAALAVASEVCDRSIIIPRRFISFTTSWHKTDMQLYDKWSSNDA